MSLDEIALKYNTDKSSKVHDYCVKYEWILNSCLPEKSNESPIKLLEIGVLNGASIQMWNEYFWNANPIVGLDINPLCKQYEKDGITIEIGSQSDVDFLNQVIAKHGDFDLIIDDGSHIQSDVIISFETLWPNVTPGGLYIVEDVVTSYWESHQGGLHKPGSMVEYFKKLADDVNYHGIHSGLIVNGVPHPHARRNIELVQAAKEYNKKLNEPIRLDIEFVMFYNSFIVIKKHSQEVLNCI